VSAVRIEPGTLVDICDLLQADTIELDGSAVRFVRRLPTDDTQTWTAELGHWMVADGLGWSVLPDAGQSVWRTAGA